MILCSCGNIAENEDTGLCATCGHALRKAERQEAKQSIKNQKNFEKLSQARKDGRQSPINRVSGKMAKYLSEYSRRKQIWIKGRKCAVFPTQVAVDIHHKKGRQGYADQWARDHDVPLLLDERFWLPVSRMGHNKIELNPEWAKKEGFSLPRTGINL